MTRCGLLVVGFFRLASVFVRAVSFYGTCAHVLKLSATRRTQPGFEFLVESCATIGLAE